MPRTYRTMANTMGYVDMRDTIPRWAKGYAVGDEIGFRHPETETVTAVPVAGFSTGDGHKGCPVFDGRPFPDLSGSSIYLNPSDVVPLNHIVDEAIDRRSD